MTVCAVEDLGCFTQGEIPMESLLNTYQDAAGQPIDISGMQVRFTFWERWTRQPTTRNGTVVNGSAGQAGYSFDGSEFASPGHWEADLWVGNGVNRIAADRFRWTVARSVGPVPAI